MLHKLFELLRSFLILYGILFIGEWIAKLIPIGIPASILGLLILFLCLVLRIIPLHWVLFSANLLVRYMAVLFVPVSVGVIKYTDLLVEQFSILLLPNILSTMLGLVVIAFLADYFFYHSSFSGLRKKVLKKRQLQAKS